MPMMSTEFPYDPALVRRFEAVGARAWPAASVSYDGAWAVRMTPGLASRRLNSINPLDPGDTRDIDVRIKRLAAQFIAAGQRPCFRLTPLAPTQLDEALEKLNWVRKRETIVMQLELSAIEMDRADDLSPLNAISDYVRASLANHDHLDEQEAAFSALLGRIQPAKGMFVIEDNGVAVANVLCVQDRDLAGIFDLCTRVTERRNGYAKRLMHSALCWARKNGARLAWLQIEADNKAALAFYQQLGFKEVYRYAYRESEEI